MTQKVGVPTKVASLTKKFKLRQSKKLTDVLCFYNFLALLLREGCNDSIWVPVNVFVFDCEISIQIEPGCNQREVQAVGVFDKQNVVWQEEHILDIGTTVLFSDNCMYFNQSCGIYSYL
jgi:hypothetical protein